MNTLMRSLLISLTLIFVTACGGGTDAPVPPLSTVQISWNANPETAVNQSGGGYKVYYSSNSVFNISDSGVTEIDVPYSSGATTPTSTQVQFLAGTYYIRIIAYSALNAPGTSGGSSSTATPQTILIVS